MTFCIGIRVHAGLVVLSDTRVVKGSESSRKCKLSTLTDGRSEAVVMTSGLRSVRDKVVARLEDRLEATDDAPYFVIGRSSYGKPILDRLLRADSSLEQAISLAYLAFDATRASTTDVDFPIDIGVQPRDREHFTMRRFTSDDMARAHSAWHDHLRQALDLLPTPWSDLDGSQGSE